ncbi:MAG: hypothetical protein ACR2FM_01990 [Candidatus Saccharimonadales bacterium]
MGKLAKILVAGTMSVAMFGGVASAETFECSINSTGPDSENICTSSTEKDFTFKCENDLNIKFTNEQVAETGAAVTDGNTSGGRAISGDAKNINDLDVLIEAGCAQEIAKQTPAAPTTPAGGQGGGPVAQAPAPAPGRGAAAPAPAPAQGVVLPDTGVDETVKAAAITVASLAGIAGAVTAGTSFYRSRVLN